MQTQMLIDEAYSAFGRRDVDATLALMTEDVSWPKASEGGRVVGKQEIREYWTRQWAVFNVSLKVLELIDREDGKTEVKVHQLVRSLDGAVLSDTELRHIYTIRNGLIERMDIVEADGNTENQSAAFADHS